MSHKQAKRIRAQLKTNTEYQQAANTVVYEKTNVAEHVFTNLKLAGRTYKTSTDVASSETKRGIYRRAKSAA